MKCDSVLIWGRDGGNVKTSKNIVSVAAGECHILIATSSSVYATGNNGWGQLGIGHNDTTKGVNKVKFVSESIQQVAAGR